MDGIEIFWLFSKNGFGKNIGFLVSAPTFGLGGSRIWEKKDKINISGKKRNMRSIWMKVGLYEVCLSYIIYCLQFYFMTILTPFFLYIFVSLSLGEGNSRIIGQKDSSCKRTRIQMNVEDKSC